MKYLSLTFDDSRQSQLDVALPILESYGVKGTFYLYPNLARLRVNDWKKAVALGHEIGNHTFSHPFHSSSPWSSGNAIDTFSSFRIEGEIEHAQGFISTYLQVIPDTFAYPGGLTQISGGESYAPLVAARFLAARLFEPGPFTGDLHRIPTIDIDNASALPELEACWTTVTSHEVGVRAPQCTSKGLLNDLISKALDEGVKIAPIQEVAKWIKNSQ